MHRARGRATEKRVEGVGKGRGKRVSGGYVMIPGYFVAKLWDCLHDYLAIYFYGYFCSYVEVVCE